MQTKRRRLFWGLGGALAFTAAAGGLFVATSHFAKRGDDLLGRATPLVAPDVWRGTASGSTPPGGGTYSPRYFWRNNNEVLRFAKKGTGTTATQTLVLLNVVTGRAQVVAHAPPLVINQRFLSVSPNGEWLLCADKTRKPSRFLAIALDGTGRSHTWKDGPANDVVHWFRDSRRFVSTTYDWTRKFSVARVYDLAADKPGKVSRLPDVVRKTSGVPMPWRNALYPVGQLPGGRFLGSSVQTITTRSGGPSAATAPLIEFGIGDKTVAPARTITVPAPATKSGPATGGILPAVFGTGAYAYSSRHAQLSPQGDRLLWVVNTFEFSSAYGARGGALRRVLPYVYRVLPKRFRPRTSFRDDYEIYTARVDGRGGLTLIGSARGEEGRSGGNASDFQWAPDGKRIAFMYKNALYTVRADGS